jgi:hypothetical protein
LFEVVTHIQKISKGLDHAHPFNETYGVDLILQEAEEMLSHHVEAVGAKNAGQIWAFMSKFVMLDHFGAALRAT